MSYYVGSLWHEFCDPFCTVIATTEQAAQDALNTAAWEEYEQILEDEPAYQDDICASGVFLENSLEPFVLSSELAQVMHDLTNDGIAYL